ncbi:MAG: hydroxyacid dehydrogenase, partial [Chitinophagaceae bacterium]|nr:hydroxyacid dehydrogenase [Chitinophagaceae bacterium]
MSINTNPLPEGNYGNPAHLPVLITAYCHNWLIDTLSRQYHVLYQPQITYEQTANLMPALHGLVVTTRLSIDRNLLQQGNSLKWIGRLGSGLELIDVAYATEKGIKVVSSPEGNSPAVGEHALALLLGVLNRVVCSHNEVGNGLWLRNENRGTELSGKTVGIIGYGHTGSAFARFLQPFGVTVLAYDKYKSGFAAGYIKEASLEQLQRYADVISFHVPLTPETNGMANEDFFNRLEARPVLLNTSRGKVVKLNDLKHALETGKLWGAGLDVLENEKPATRTSEEKELLNWL